MKRILSGLFLLTALSVNAHTEERKVCITDEKYKEALLEDPSILQRRQQLENFTQQWIQRAQTERRGNTVVYVIPLVFHILHNYGTENISDEQVIDAVRILNEDFRKLNFDTTQIIQEFKGIAADCEIEFRLATIDPNGNCTNGIERIVTQRTYVANDASKLNPWPHDKYLNIWTAYSLENTGAAAYAYYPGAANPISEDGIMSLSHYVGSIGTSNYNNSRTLTHEMGHCLNLSHTWGSGNGVGASCGDDNVNDTPITKGFSSCPAVPSNAAVCNPPIIENYQNHMDYSYCTFMFTEGQKSRMIAALNSPIGGRNNLWTSSNLAATGALASPAPVCVPVADFYSSPRYACEGTQVTFYDNTWNAEVSSYNWSFPGGNPSSSTDSLPVVAYPAAGTYDVTLVVTNSTGTDSVAKTGYIIIGGTPTAMVPYSESFEDSTSAFPYANSYIINPDNGITWTRVTNTASTGMASIRINNYVNTDGEIDEWVSEPIDFSNVQQPYVHFKYANAQRNSSSEDELKLFGSLNCGQTWAPRWSKKGPSLSTAGIVSVSFVPNPSQWRSDSTNMNPFAMKPNVRIKWQNISDRGNNTYLDDIYITGNIVSVDELEEITTGFTLYPNPTTGTSKVGFQLSKASHVNIIINDVLGKELNRVINADLQGGSHEFTLPQMPAGIYLINLQVNDKTHVRKLIVS